MKKIFHSICFSLFSTCVAAQTLNVHSVMSIRGAGSDIGYTLDGARMSGARAKLLNPQNFGPSGTYAKSAVITDGYLSSGSLAQVVTVPYSSIFFFGSFDIANPGTQAFTSSEIDSLYRWSKRGGKMIICAGGTYPPQFGQSYDSRILNLRWGFFFVPTVSPSYFVPTSLGSNSDIFNGPFGTLPGAYQQGSIQGYFDPLPVDIKILAANPDGKPTLYMDCATLDLISADVDGYTTGPGSVTSGGIVQTEQDQFWVNTIAFMDKLQPMPVISNNNNNLTLNAAYNSYQWYHNGEALAEGTSPELATAQPGTYYAEVTVNGGCKVKSGEVVLTDIVSGPGTGTVITVSPDECEVFIPTAFSPNQNNLNDLACVYGPCIKDIDFKIYDRWGELVFETTDKSNCWDGSYKGKTLNNAVFAWTLDATLRSGRHITKKGNITLIH